MAYRFNPFSGTFDLIGTSTGMPTSGGTFTGDVTFPITGFIMVSPDGTHWRVTVDNLGSLVTTVITATDAFLLEDGSSFLLLETGDKLLLG